MRKSRGADGFCAAACSASGSRDFKIQAQVKVTWGLANHGTDPSRVVSASNDETATKTKSYFALLCVLRVFTLLSLACWALVAVLRVLLHLS